MKKKGKAKCASHCPPHPPLPSQDSRPLVKTSGCHELCAGEVLVCYSGVLSPSFTASPHSSRTHPDTDVSFEYIYFYSSLIDTFSGKRSPLPLNAIATNAAALSYSGFACRGPLLLSGDILGCQNRSVWVMMLLQMVGRGLVMLSSPLYTALSSNTNSEDLQMHTGCSGTQSMQG